MKLSVVIPAKNESATIGLLVTELVSQFRDNIEVLVVDDGSTDSTAEKASNSGAKVISHPVSLGNGAAIKTGARAAVGDILIFMDADGQHKPSDLMKLLPWIDKGYDLVIGARSKAAQANTGRAIANKIFNLMAGYMTGRKIPDLTSGFRVVRAKRFKEFLYLLPNKFSYPTTSTMAFFRAGYSVKFESVDVAPRDGVSHISPVKDGLRFLMIIFKVATLYSPLKVFLPVSLVFLSLGLSHYGVTYYTESRFTNMSALLLSVSVLIFLIGLVSEQITALLYRK